MTEINIIINISTSTKINVSHEIRLNKVLIAIISDFFMLSAPLADTLR